MRDDALEPADLYDRNMTVVDVGGGTGFTTLGIVKHVDAKNVTILDQSPHQLAKAKEQGPLKECKIIEGDAADLPFPTDYADRYVSAGRFIIEECCVVVEIMAVDSGTSSEWQCMSLQQWQRHHIGAMVIQEVATIFGGMPIVVVLMLVIVDSAVVAKRSCDGVGETVTVIDVLGPKVEDVRKPVNPFVFLFR
ncbi:hypothetical protein J5N97_000460 [Dioscorea zingiberensis]|uniref:MPBQ/MBSQ family SAM-binding methyltransferase profile domain-containing protein n=1 Tax=Dioscorea zingiberensis TaxID=325984 RepID=A0A9D5H1J4_9LILI|nr:hypothetical protein J5N97_000460 [Dioscorea zingiberensis]